MLEVIFPLDSTKPFTEQKLTGHNRWHPDIPPVATLKRGESYRIDCREWFDGAIKNDDSADDIRDAPLHKVHTLSGPFRIEGALDQPALAQAFRREANQHQPGGRRQISAGQHGATQ